MVKCIYGEWIDLPADDIDGSVIEFAMQSDDNFETVAMIMGGNVVANLALSIPMI